MHDPKALPQTPLNTLRRPGRPDPADAEQLRHAPVSLRRIARLFAPFRWQMGVVIALIVASSVISLANPFIIRKLIDDALPQQNVDLLVSLVALMLLITITVAVLGVFQTW